MSLQPVLGKMSGFQPDGGPSNFCGFDTYPDGTWLNRHQPQVHTDLFQHRCTPLKFHMEPEKRPLQKGEILLEKKTLIFRFHVKLWGGVLLMEEMRHQLIW